VSVNCTIITQPSQKQIRVISVTHFIFITALAKLELFINCPFYRRALMFSITFPQNALSISSGLVDTTGLTWYCCCREPHEI